MFQKRNKRDVECMKLQDREINNYMRVSHPFLPQYYVKFIAIEYIQGKTLNKETIA